jgi:hypothetical protein
MVSSPDARTPSECALLGPLRGTRAPPRSAPASVSPPYGGAAGVSAQTSAGSRDRGRAMAGAAGRPMCSRILRAVALSVIAASRRSRPPQRAQRRTSVANVRRMSFAHSTRGAVARRSPWSNLSMWRTEMPKSVIATSAGARAAAEARSALSRRAHRPVVVL